MTTPAVKTEKINQSSVIGSASSITIGKKADGSIKLLSPTKAPNTNLHTVNIPGKGMQIVRLLNPGASSSSATTIVSPKAAETVQQPRVIVQSRGGQTLTVLSPGQRQQQQHQQQIQRPSTSTGAPRILNQSMGNFQSKSELNGQRPVQIIKKTISSPTEGTPPPTKKTKFITLTTSQISQIQGATIMGGGKQKKIVMLPSNYREQLEKISEKAAKINPQTTFKIVQDFQKVKPKVEVESPGTGEFNKTHFEKNLASLIV